MAKSNLRHKANNKMTTAQKAEKVFQSGLAFRIWNKPVKDPNTEENLWDIRIFWMHTEYDNKSLVTANKNSNGFANVDDCLDDMLKYLENYE